MADHHFDLSGSLSKSRKYPEKIGRYSDFYTGTCIKRGYGLPKVVGIKALRGFLACEEVFTKEFTEKFKKHAERWVTFDHANVARCYGYALDCGPLPAIIMDYYPEGEIMQYMKEKRSSNEEKIKMIRDVAEGLCYLHSLQPPVVHGDLRAANIFVTKTGRAVIADYELGCMIPSRDYTGYVFEENIGWLAPELLLEDNRTCTTATDVFALAMTIVEIISNDAPFALKRNAMVLRLRDIDWRPDLPDEVLGCKWLPALVRTCWSGKRLERPKTSDIVEIFVTNSV